MPEPGEKAAAEIIERVQEPLHYLSVCSGIEAATVAWEPLGWRALAYSEIERFPCAVLKAHYPMVPNWGDLTKFQEWPVANPDVLVGGTPCQSFSVAGLRKGLADPRGNLMLTYLAVAAKYQPEWLVWENVPGVLSSNGGLDFASLLRGLGVLGYGFSYRILDAQYFGVAQRRRRVFVIGNSRGWQRAAAVLFERASLRGDPAPSRQKEQAVAPTIRSGVANGGAGHGSRGGDKDELIVATSLTTAQRYADPSVETYIIPPRIEGGVPEVSPTLQARDFKGPSQRGDGAPIIVTQAFAQNQREEVRGLEVAGALASIRRGDGKNETLLSFHNRQDPDSGAVTHALSAQDNGLGLLTGQTVRRLTPRECERLQGFPDDYTAIQYRGKAAADGPRYKALGNSMAVPCMAWLGKRIAAVHAVCHRDLGTNSKEGL